MILQPCICPDRGFTVDVMGRKVERRGKCLCSGGTPAPVEKPPAEPTCSTCPTLPEVGYYPDTLATWEIEAPESPAESGRRIDPWQRVPPADVVGAVPMRGGRRVPIGARPAVPTRLAVPPSGSRGEFPDTWLLECAKAFESVARTLTNRSPLEVWHIRRAWITHCAEQIRERQERWRRDDPEVTTESIAPQAVARALLNQWLQEHPMPPSVPLPGMVPSVATFARAMPSGRWPVLPNQPVPPPGGPWSVAST